MEEPDPGNSSHLTWSSSARGTLEYHSPSPKKEITNTSDTFFKGYLKASRDESDGSTHQTHFNRLF